MKFPRLAGLAFLLFSQMLSAQFTYSDVKYWVGSGSDSTVMVVDFKDATRDSSYAWGYIYNAPATAEDMLRDIAASDVNFNVVISGNNLDHIAYQGHIGIEANPGSWSFWDGIDLGTLSPAGNGISTNLINGGYFGFAYNFGFPALSPGPPIAAFDPFVFTFSDIKFFVGNGSDTAMLVIDFLDIGQPSSFAWGYLFNDSTTGQQMLNDIAAADPGLTVNINSGNLEDIYYQGLIGEEGNPNYWNTWTATNYGNWQPASGISVSVFPGELFGCTYVDFATPVRPDYPAAAPQPIGISENLPEDFQIYPIPAKQYVELSFEDNYQGKVVLINSRGQQIQSQTISGHTTRLNLKGLPAGIYLIQSDHFTQKLLKQ